MTRFAELLQVLAAAEVEFVLIGGLAATAHGSVRFTQDLDLVYRRTAANLDRLVAALGPLEPYLRGAPPGLPFRFDAPTLKAGLNFTLETRLGWIDLLGEVTGGGRYEDLLPHTDTVVVHGSPCRILNLDWLIRTKEAAGRPKDLEAVAELKALRERS